MSSREVLCSAASEEKDGPPASAQAQHGQPSPLSLNRHGSQHTPSGSLKRLADPPASPAKTQASGSSASMEAALSGDIPEPSVSALVPESLDPTNTPLPDASVSIATPEPPESEPVTDSEKVSTDQSCDTLSEHRSPRLNCERQHRAVKKFRPPDNGNTLTPEMGGHAGLRGRRARHHCDPQTEAKSQGSSPGDGNNLGSLSISKEKKTNSEEMVTEQNDGEVCKPELSR